MNKRIKNIIIALIILLILGMAVAYAAITQTLIINGTARVTGNVGVVITNISESGNFTSLGTDTKAPSYTGTTATFDATLSEPGETVTYVVTVQNKGNVEATVKTTNYKVGTSVDNIAIVANLQEVNSANPSDITFTVNGPTVDPLPVNAIATYIVTATWNSSATSLSPTSVKTMIMELVYEQAV